MQEELKFIIFLGTKAFLTSSKASLVAQFKELDQCGQPCVSWGPCRQQWECAEPHHPSSGDADRRDTGKGECQNCCSSSTGIHKGEGRTTQSSIWQRNYSCNPWSKNQSQRLLSTPWLSSLTSFECYHHLPPPLIQVALTLVDKVPSAFNKEP